MRAHHCDENGDGAGRLRNTCDNVIRGKRGAANHQPAAGSPRPVRARLRDQQQGKVNAPFAIARRCSYGEYTGWIDSKMQNQSDGAESRIEPNAFPFEDDGAPRRRVLGDCTAAVNSCGNTDADNFAVGGTRSAILKDLKYPPTDPGMSAITGEVLRQQMSQGAGDALGQVLTCALNDEFAALEREWGIDANSRRSKNPDVAVAGKVVAMLKRFSHRAEKACTLQSFDARAPSSAALLASGNTDAAIRQRCSELQAKIAAKNQEIASLRQALDQPTQVPHAGSYALANLKQRLDAAALEEDQRRQSGAEDVATIGVPALTNNQDQILQGLGVAAACCRRMWQQCQEEQEILQERNREFCALPPPTSSDHEVLRGLHKPAMGILRDLM